MSNNNGPISRSPTPSTPPFLNIASPDFKSYKQFLRSPNKNIENDERLQLSEMDFESAYAILTRSPTFNNQTTPLLGSPQPLLGSLPLQHPAAMLLHNEHNDTTHNFVIDSSLDLNSQSPRSLRYALNRPLSTSSSPTLPSIATSTNANSTLTNSAASPTGSLDVMDEMSDLLFKSNKPPPLPLPTTLSNQHSKLLSPIENMVDLESLQYFSKYDELLSVNETNALEQFLDSIIDDKKTKTDPPATKIHTNPACPYINNIDFDDAYDQAVQTLETLKAVERHNDGVLSLGSPLVPMFENPQKRLFEEVKQETTTLPPAELPKKERKKRKVLSEEQKKLNHTSSEQKRRTAIKDAFDGLVNLLPSLNDEKSLSRRKSLPKSIVLEKAAFEIERLINVNNELKRILKENA